MGFAMRRAPTSGECEVATAQGRHFTGNASIPSHQVVSGKRKCLPHAM